jgi:flagellar biosynthesis protein FliQ
VSFSLAVTSFFGGLLIGLIQEGSEKAGLRYIPILIAVSLSIFFLTRLMVERLFGAMV